MLFYFIEGSKFFKKQEEKEKQMQARISEERQLIESFSEEMFTRANKEVSCILYLFLENALHNMHSKNSKQLT